MRFLLTLLAASSLVGAGEHSNRRGPGFALPDINLNHHDLYDYRGKIVLLDFLQTQCPVCISSQRIFETIRQKFPDKVAVVSVVLPPDSQNTVRAFITQNAMKTPVLFDCGQVAAAYTRLTPSKPQMIFPHLFLLDWNGWIRNDYVYGPGAEQVFESLGPLMKEVTALVNEMAKSVPAAKPAPAPANAPRK